MSRIGFRLVFASLLLAAMAGPSWAQDAGRKIYMARCFWCHGERGDGNGPSAVGMVPRPRDFVSAEYKIRSTGHGQLPTDEDLYGTIAHGFPGTPMPGWKDILTEPELRDLVRYLKSLSPRFQSEKPESLPVPSGPASLEHGREVYQAARCWMCHGSEGRSDGGITTTIHFEWGIPYTARDFTRGWTFKGGHTPGDIYLRITGGLNGSPMGPYKDLLSDQERWDVAHYIASLDREPIDSSENFLITAALVEGELPTGHDAAEWTKAHGVLVPLAGQVVSDPPLRWWLPTTSSAMIRALWNRGQVAFLLEWNDPTGPENRYADSALLQFAAQDGAKPYFLLGDKDNPVKVWHWQAADHVEEWTANGRDQIKIDTAGFQVSSSWEAGRWHVIFRRSLAGEPNFKPGGFVPVVVSVRDGGDGEIDDVRAVSTWLYATLERPPSRRPALFAVACFLAAVLAQLWMLSKLES